jgi:hypothetical protein
MIMNSEKSTKLGGETYSSVISSTIKLTRCHSGLKPEAPRCEASVKLSKLWHGALSFCIGARALWEECLDPRGRRRLDKIM